MGDKNNMICSKVEWSTTRSEKTKRSGVLGMTRWRTEENGDNGSYPLVSTLWRAFSTSRRALSALTLSRRGRLKLPRPRPGLMLLS